jgi:hypothetical protein
LIKVDLPGRVSVVNSTAVSLLLSIVEP